MRKAIYTTAILLLAFIGYSCFKSDVNSYDKLTIQIAQDTTEKLQRDIPELHLGGWGGQINGAQVVHLDFDILHEIELESGRDLILRITNELLDAYNHDPKFRSYIKEYPFTVDNLQIELYFSTPSKGELPPGVISVISIHKGKIRYKGGNSDQPFSFGGYRNMTFHEESYEDAMQASHRG